MRQQCLELLREKMPLPVIEFSRSRRGEVVLYTIKMDASGVLDEGIPNVTIAFILRANALPADLIAKVEGSAKALRRKVEEAQEMPSLPGT